jgi:thiol-disulfide isomerase/thioredoxin
MENRTWTADPTDTMGGHDRMPLGRRWLVPLALLLAGCLVFALRSSSESDTTKVIGNRMPEVSLKGLTGSDRSIRSEDLAGKVVLLNFWATWCGPCRIELPHLAELEKKLSSRDDFQFLAVSIGPAATANDLAAMKESTAEFLDGVGLDIRAYADPGYLTYDGLRELVQSQEPSLGEGLPTTIVLDRGGIIREIWLGYAPGLEIEIEETVTRLLDGDGE